MPTIQLTSDDGFSLSAYRAEPTGEPRGGLVIVQEVFGVTSHIRAVADEFAREGYLAIAPALLDRVERGVELGYDAAGLARGRALVGRIETEALMRDLAAARDAASSAGRVGTVGYCWGGSVVWMVAALLDGLTCAVSYYGSRIVQLTELEPKVPVLMHVGREDASFPVEKAREIAARHAHRVTLCEWQAGHGFNCDQRADYKPEIAAAALDRTLAFLREHVG